MKKLLSFILAILLGFSAVACSGGGGEATSAVDPGNDSTSEPVTDPGNDSTSEPADTTEDTDPIEEDKMLNILFLGNSLMYYNDMPVMFENMAKAAGKEVNVQSVTKGSATISDFADTRTAVGAQAIPLLQNNPWDIVIIEPSRRITPYENTVKEAELESAKKIQELAKAAGGDVLLYATWGNNNGGCTEFKAVSPIAMVEGTTHKIGRKTHTAFMQSVNAEYASALGGVKVADAGYAFENFIAAHPSVNLYHTDERHPSLAGSYLAACVIYATIYGESVKDVNFTSDLASADRLKAIADATVLEGLMPDLTEDEAVDPFNLLIVGSNKMDDYACATVFGRLVKEAEGRTVTSTYVRSSTFVINNIVNESNDLGFRAALADTEWDAIIVQISRRCTLSGTDVVANELNALKTVLPLMKAETDKIYLFTLDGAVNAPIFTTADGNPGYTKTGQVETLTAVEGSAFYKDLADTWVAELGLAGVINYGQAYHDYANPAKSGLGYLQGVMIYNTIFGKALPDNVTDTNELSAAAAESLRAIAAKYCLNP